MDDTAQKSMKHTSKPAAAWWLSPPLYRFLCPSPSLSRQSGGRFLLIAGTSLQQPGHGTAADQHCQQTVTPYLVRPPTVSSPVLSCLVCIPVDVRMCTVHVACCMVRAASGDSGYCTLVPIPLPQTIRCAVLWSCLIAAALPSSLPPPSLPPSLLQSGGARGLDLDRRQLAAKQKQSSWPQTYSAGLIPHQVRSVGPESIGDAPATDATRTANTHAHATDETVAW